MTGIVIWFDDLMGYGFIEDRSKREVFIHFSEIVSPDERKTLHPGDKVEFDLYEGNKGFFASKVKKL